MQWMRSLLGLLAVAFVHSSTPTWDTLKVTWDILHPISRAFHKMPMTKQEAKASGFIAAEDGKCSDFFKGVRYYDPKDIAVSMLYDVGGYLAGIQMNFVASELKGPGTEDWFKQGDMFVKNKFNNVDVYTVTAYFVNPDIICNKGRTAEEFKMAPGGNQLSFKTKTGSVKAPLLQTDADKDPYWTKGKCFVSMGVHYWFNTSKDMDCNKLRPVFLLYNHGGHLTGCGFSVIAKLTNSIRYEYPPKFSFKLFMAEVPQCLLKRFDEVGGITTMHVYLNSALRNLICI